MSRQPAEHSIVVAVLENEGYDTGCFGAFCSTCTMWVGPHRDSEEEAESDAKRHNSAVGEQHLKAAPHRASVYFDRSEFVIMKGIMEDTPENPLDFGPYFASCDDCGGLVSLGRVTEKEASTESEQHRAAFDAIRARSLA